jgi:hypothetical protein
MGGHARREDIDLRECKVREGLDVDRITK